MQGAHDELSRNVPAEVTVGLELSLGEKLSRRGLVRESGVRRTILPDRLGLVPGHRQLDVEELAGLGAVVVDLAQRAVAAAESGFVQPQGIEVDLDVAAQVHSRIANEA